MTLWIRIWTLRKRGKGAEIWIELPKSEVSDWLSATLEVETVSACGVDLSPRPTKSRVTLSSGSSVCVIFVGSLEWSHRLGEVLGGCELLWKKDMDFELHFVDKPGQANGAFIPEWLLKRWISRAKGRLIWHREQDLPDFLFIEGGMAVRGGHDSLERTPPMSLLRARAAGMALLGPNASYFRRLVLSGRTGYWVDSVNSRGCGLIVLRSWSPMKVFAKEWGLSSARM